MKAHLILVTLAVAATSCAATSPICSPTKDLKNTEYFPHPTDCQKFFTCFSGNEVEFTCPEGTYWNDPIKACDHKQNVHCPSDAPSATTESTTSTTTTEQVSSDAPFATDPTTPASGKCPEVVDPEQQVFLPHADCTKFYICTWGGAAVEKECPAGLHWNQHANVCDYPQQAGCVPSSTGSTTTIATEAPSTTTEWITPEQTPAVTTTTTVEITSEVPTTPTSGTSAPAGKCPEIFDPANQAFLPHADCSKFYICSWLGAAVEKDCPAGLHWNPNANYCDYPHQAGCVPASTGSTAEPTTSIGTEAPLSTTTSTTTTTASTTTAVTTTAAPGAPSDKCPEDYDANDQVFLPHADCTKFYICTWGGVAVEKDCPAGLHWNQHASVCDYPQQAGCIPGSTGSTAEPTTSIATQTPSTTPKPTTEATTTSSAIPSTVTSTTTTSGTPAPAGKCPEIFDPTNQAFLPHADCSKFYICSWAGAAVEKDCPAGLHWNPIANYCDYPQHAGCVPADTTAEPTTSIATEVPSTATSTAATTTTTGPVFPSDECPEDYVSNDQVFLPHADCTKYYICTWGGVAVEQYCPAGLHWNQNANACDYPQQAGCDPSSIGTTEAPTSASTAAPRVPSVKCPEQYDASHQVFLSHDDCAKFYSCTWGGIAVEQNCPAGLHWNQNANICDYPQQAVCVPISNGSTVGPTTTTETPLPTSSAATTSAPIVPSDKCPEQYDPYHQVYFPHSDCTKYYICTYEGSKLEQNCPAGLHWSQALSYCDVPEVAQCA